MCHWFEKMGRRSLEKDSTLAFCSALCGGGRLRWPSPLPWGLQGRSSQVRSPDTGSETIDVFNLISRGSVSLQPGKRAAGEWQDCYWWGRKASPRPAGPWVHVEAFSVVGGCCSFFQACSFFRFDLPFCFLAAVSAVTGSPAFTAQWHLFLGAEWVPCFRSFWPFHWWLIHLF